MFLDRGVDRTEAKVMALRAEVTICIQQHLKATSWVQEQGPRRVGIARPRVPRPSKGQWQYFSLEDMLLTRATRAGLTPDLRLAALSGRLGSNAVDHNRIELGDRAAIAGAAIKTGCPGSACDFPQRMGFEPIRHQMLRRAHPRGYFLRHDLRCRATCARWHPARRADGSSR